MREIDLCSKLETVRKSLTILGTVRLLEVVSAIYTLTRLEPHNLWLYAQQFCTTVAFMYVSVDTLHFSMKHFRNQSLLKLKHFILWNSRKFFAIRSKTVIINNQRIWLQLHCPFAINLDHLNEGIHKTKGAVIKKLKKYKMKNTKS